MAGLDLVAQGVDRFGGGPDPDQPGVGNSLGKGGVLGQEAIPGVDRVSAGFGCDVEQLLLHQVCVTRSCSVESVRFVRDLDVQRVTIRICIDGNGTNSAVPTCTSDTDGDLAPVCDQYFADRHHTVGA